MDKDKIVRLSIVIDSKYHKKLKIFCANLGISITQFVLKSTEESMEFYEKGKLDGFNLKENL